MRSSKEEAQDRALHLMEKTLRNARNDKSAEKGPLRMADLSLKDQLAEQKRIESLTPAERRTEMSFTEWEYELEDNICHKLCKTTPRRLRVLVVKHKEQFRQWHKDGTTYLEIGRWIEEQPDLL
jgi:hypothetical protein